MSILGLLIVVSLALGVLAWLFFVWTVRSGQYDDPEGAKYRMLEDEEPAQSPAADAKPPAAPAATQDPSAPDASAPRPDPAVALRTTARAATPQPPSRVASKKPPPAPASEVPPSRRNGVHRP